MKIKKTAEDRAVDIFVYGIMLAAALITVIPFANVLSKAFSADWAVTSGQVGIFPIGFNVDSFNYVFHESTFRHSMLMSVAVTVTATVSGIIITAVTAYPLSKKHLPGIKPILFLFVFTMLFNGGMVPTYMVYANTLHIKNTIWALIVPYLLMNAFYIITMRTYINSNISDEIIEAARIDGSGEVQTLFRIVIPLSKPIIATIALLAMISYWNNWTNGIYFLSDDDLYGVQNFLNEVITNATFLASKTSGSTMSVQIPTVGVRMAIAVVAVIPVLIAYPFFQKSFVKGITLGAVKG